jgi:hypothetical protein
VVEPVGFGQLLTATALPVLTMVCGYWRWASAVLISTRAADDLYAGWWQHLSTLGATPRVMLEGEGAVGRRRQRQVRLPTGDWHAQQVAKEQYWLPRVAPLLPLPIPEPVAKPLSARGSSSAW